MTTTTVTYTPWGWTRDIEELAEGVWRVSTPSHGGLKLSLERWDSLPAELRDAMYTQTFAEEDCEEPIVRTLLGLGDDREREMALKVAGYFDRYAPALPTSATARRASTTTQSPSPADSARTPSGGSTPASRPSPSWATPRWFGPTGGWRPSSAPGRARSASERQAGHDHDDAAPAPHPAQHNDQAPDRVRQPLRHRLDGRGRRALRGVRLAGEGRQLPARGHRACLPVDLPAPAAGNPARRGDRPDARASSRDAALLQHDGRTARALPCSASATASPTSSRPT